MQMQGEEGFAVRRGEVSRWRWNGTVEADGFLYATFADSGDLKSMASLSQLPPEQCLAGIISLLYARQKLLEHPGADSEGQEQRLTSIPEGIFIVGVETWFFLPPSLAAVLAEEISADELDRRYLRQRGERRLAAYSLHLLYRSLTSRSPFEEDEAVAAHPHLYEPRLREEPADFIHRINRSREVPTAEELSRELQRFRHRLIDDDLHEDEIEVRRGRAEAELGKEVKRRARRRAAARIGPPVGLGLASLFVILFLLSPLGGVRKKEDPTAGLSAREIVELYYQSINRLEHETMDDCTKGRVGSRHMDEVTTLYVITRIRQGVERTDSFLRVKEWEETGRPPLENHRFVYGISDLEVKEVSSQEEGTRAFDVAYLKYSTLPAETPSGADREELESLESTGIVEIMEIEERLLLEETQEGRFRIVDIDQKKRQLKKRLYGEE